MTTEAGIGVRKGPVAWTVIVALCACSGAGDVPAGAAAGSGMAPAHNTLSPAEAADGWRLLFDGESVEGWRGYGRADFPHGGWRVDGGELVGLSSSGDMDGGDILTTAEFTDFELVFDFKVGPEGNSGVFYRVVEHEGMDLWQVAPEYQVLDDTAYIDMGTMDMNKHLTGDNYDLQSSVVTASNPIGEWNHGRIVVDGAHVEHWLNGQMTVEYDFWSPEWEALVAESKFAPYPEYGRATEGRIGIQDHGHEIRYKNIKVRPLGGGA